MKRTALIPRLLPATALLLLSVGVAPVQARSGQEILNNECQQCHELNGPAAQTLNELWDRKGPDLFYAGNKYRADWVTAWLQKPSRIRPAGTFYGNAIISGKEQDEVDPSKLITHPKLASGDAKKVTDVLMKKTTKTDLIAKEKYLPGKISMSMGEMMFDKFKGCLACHQIEPGYGGFSGPEVYTVANRLQDEYILSFMRNPQAWNPLIFMPNKHLKDRDLQKFLHYFHGLSKEDFK